MTVNGLKSLQRSLEKLKDTIDDEATDTAASILDDTERGAKSRIVQQDTVAWGDLYAGFRQRRYPIAHPRGPATRLTLTNTEPHAKFVEWGTGDYFGSGQQWGYPQPRKPYKAPSFSFRLVRAISMWLAVKPGFERVESPTSVAVPIALSISRRTKNNQSIGTEAQPFMRPAWHTASIGTHMKFRAAIGRAVGRV